MPAGSAVDSLNSPSLVRLKPSPTVATMKNTPSACTSSSFSIPIAWMKGVEGTTCTPVAAQITPVTRPTTPPTHFSWLRATVTVNLLRPTIA